LPKVKPILKPARPAVFERDWIIIIFLFYAFNTNIRTNNQIQNLKNERI